MIPSLLNRGALPIGLDLRSRAARLVQLRRVGGSHALVARALVRFDQFNGSNFDEDSLRELTNGLRDCVDSGRFTNRSCVLTLGDSVIRVRSVRQPDMPREEAERALRLEGAERLGFDNGSPAQVGWLNAGRVRHGEEMREEVILVGCERLLLERVIGAINDAGLTPRAVEPAFAANARSHCRVADQASRKSGKSGRSGKSGDEDSDAPDSGAERGVQVILDVGADHSSLTVLRDHHVAFYKVIELGGADLNRAAAAQLGLELSTVEELRLRRLERHAGSEDETVNPKVDRAIYDAVRPLLNELAQEASMCLRYYTVTFCGQRPAFIQVVGDEANEPGLVEAISSSLNVHTIVGRPFTNVARINPKSEDQSFAEWSVAAGLSLRGDVRLREWRAAA